MRVATRGGCTQHIPYDNLTQRGKQIYGEMRCDPRQIRPPSSLLPPPPPPPTE